MRLKRKGTDGGVYIEAAIAGRNGRAAKLESQGSRVVFFLMRIPIRVSSGVALQ